MAFTAEPPSNPGLYRHRKTGFKDRILFVGYTNALAHLWQGDNPNRYAKKILRCCEPDEYLHSDRLTPAEWGGEWEPVHDTPSISI